MKRSSTWFALILIASALFLNVGALKPRNAEAQSKNTQLNESTTNSEKDPTAPIATPSQPRYAATDQANTAGNTDQSKNDPQPPIDAGWWFNFFLVVFTGCLVGVGIVQAFLLYYTFQAGKLAAEATNKSVELARIALQSDRPFIAITSLTSDNPYWETQYCFGATVHFQNCGKSPAIITKLCLGYVQMSDKYWWRFTIRPPIYEWGEECSLDQPVISAGAISKFSAVMGAGSWIDEKDVDALMDHKLKLTAYGIIKYRDAFGNAYETAFTWHFRLPKIVPPNGDFYSAGEEYQRQT
jgi:hypothetical protein